MQDKLRLYAIVVSALCACGAGIALFARSIVPLVGHPWNCAVQFVIVISLVELLAINLGAGDDTDASPTGPVFWVATCFLGPLPAIAVSVVSAVISMCVRCACFHITQAWDAHALRSGDANPQRHTSYRAVSSVGVQWRSRSPGITALYAGSYTAGLVLDVGPGGIVYYLLGGHFLIDRGADFHTLRNFILPFLGLVATSTVFHTSAYALLASAVDPIPGARGLYGLLLRFRLAVIEIALPVVRGQMLLSLVALLLAYLYSQIGVMGFVLAITPLLALRDFFHQWVEERNAYLNTITTLATYMQHYHPYTRGHLKRVADMSERLARELRLPVESIRHMNAAGFLHDIGKISVSEEILDKTSKLSDDEWAKIKEHPVKGAEIIGHLEFLEGIVDWIRYHHKWYDGKGYPDGDKSDIPIEAAIIATADAFDAMTDDRELTVDWSCDSCGYKPEEGVRPKTCPKCGAEKRRVYREPKGLDDAIDEIRRGAGSQFHPRVVKAFLSMVERDGIRINA